MDKHIIHWKRRLRRLIAVLCAMLVLFLVLIVLSGLKASSNADEQSAIVEVTPTPVPTPEPIPEDVWLLAKVMQTESGINWPDWAVMLIGEVVLNRVESWRFPNSVHDVVYANNPVQYEPVYTGGWEDIEPEPEYVDLAWRLINGERPLGDPEVVFQALFPQGTKTVVTFYDKALDTRTYFCRG